jgi:hypothetical protein
MWLDTAIVAFYVFCLPASSRVVCYTPKTIVLKGALYKL